MSPAAIVELLLSGDPDQRAQGIELLRSLPELREPSRAVLLERLRRPEELLVFAGTKRRAWRTRARLGLRLAERAAATMLRDTERPLIRPLLDQLHAVIRGDVDRAALSALLDALPELAYRNRRAYSIGNAAFSAIRHTPPITSAPFCARFSQIVAEHASQVAWNEARASLTDSGLPREQRQRIAAAAQRDAVAAAKLEEEAAQLEDMRQLASALLDAYLEAR